MIELRDYQKRGISQLYTAFKMGFMKPLFVNPTGGGKCLGYDTPVIMSDGNIKPVQDIKVGDKLMGVDSLPRTVVALGRGRDLMYKITPVKGESFVCNSQHILSLVYNIDRSERVKKGSIVNIPLDEYLKLNKSHKHVLKLYRTGVDFPHQSVFIDPYFLGIWLGDGTRTNTGVTTMDKEIVDYMGVYATKLKLKVRAANSKTSGKADTYHISNCAGKITKGYRLQNSFNFYGLKGNKFIPKEFLHNTREVRLQVLAGLIDSDGTLHHNNYSITTKDDQLAEDILYLVRSLGFQGNHNYQYNKEYDRTYHRININGYTDEVPVLLPRKVAKPRQQIKNVLRTGFKVECLGEGDYYGFELSGKDRLFLLGDFTVTHNTSQAGFFVKACVKSNKRVLIFMHRTHLCKQFGERLSQQFNVSSGFIMSGTKQRQEKNIQIGMVQTLVNKIKRGELDWLNPDVIIIDEAHRSMANSYLKVIEHFPKARLVGLTATPFRADGKPLGEVYDTIVHPVKINELITKGFLTPTKVYAPKEEVDMTNVKVIAGDFKKSEMSEKFNDGAVVRGVVSKYLELCGNKKAIVFNCDVGHSKGVTKRFRENGIVCGEIYGNTPDAETERLLKDFESGKIRVLCSVGKFVEGFDVPDVEVVILNVATKSLGKYIQMTGRGLRCFEGKAECIVLDFGGNTMRHGFAEDYDLRPFSLSSKLEKENMPVKKCKSCNEGIVRLVTKEKKYKCSVCEYEKEADIREPRSFGDEKEFMLLERETLLVERLYRMPQKRAKEVLPLSQMRIYGLIKGYSAGWWMHSAIDAKLIDIDKNKLKVDPTGFWKIINFEFKMAEDKAGTRALYNSLKSQMPSKPKKKTKACLLCDKKPMYNGKYCSDKCKKLSSTIKSRANLAMA